MNYHRSQEKKEDSFSGFFDLWNDVVSVKPTSSMNLKNLLTTPAINHLQLKNYKLLKSQFTYHSVVRHVLIVTHNTLVCLLWTRLLSTLCD